MSVSSRDSEHRSGTADHNRDSSSLSSKRPHRRPRNSSDASRYIRCPRLNNEHVNELLRKYKDNGVSNRKKISELLAKEHGVNMSEATVARRRRTLKLTKRPGAPTDIPDVEKRLYIWKDRDVGYRGLRRSRAIQRALKEDYDIHITEAYISQALKGVDEGKTGPHGEWRIDIYQPFPELDLCITFIRDAWTGGWIDFWISCNYKYFLVEIAFHYVDSVLDLGRIPKQTTINQSQEFEPANILRKYLSGSISLDQVVNKISRVQLNYPIIKGAPEELSNPFREVMRCWEERKDSYNAADSDLRYRLPAKWLWELTVRNELQDHYNAHSFYKHCDEISLRDSDFSGEILEDEKYTKTRDLWKVLREAIPKDKSANRTKDVWDHLYPSKDWWDGDILNLSSLWTYFEQMLSLWKSQFTLNNTGEWIFTEGFVDPDDVPESPPLSSSILPSEDPHHSYGSEETETHYPYRTSITPFLLQESPLRGTYVSDPMPEASSYQLPSFSSYPGGGTPIYPKPTQHYVSSMVSNNAPKSRSG
ncbi:hypothetical protein M422DRAFT_239815 [Sphaerobolus stellatus SS14]|nr:hypothetical protein M422DRAFT_239815 [Sphaerobolus stellatus SS14]